MYSIWLCSSDFSVSCLKEISMHYVLLLHLYNFIFFPKSQLFHLNVVQSLAAICFLGSCRIFFSVLISSESEMSILDKVSVTKCIFSYFSIYSVSPALWGFLLFLVPSYRVCDDILFRPVSHIWLAQWVSSHPGVLFTGALLMACLISASCICRYGSVRPVLITALTCLDWYIE